MTLPTTPRATPVDPAIRRARAGLLRTTEPPAPVMLRFIAAHGVLPAWDAVRTHRAPTNAELPTWVHDADPTELDATVDSDLDTAASVGARLISPEHDEWPAAALMGLQQAHTAGTVGAAPPIALYVRGATLTDVPNNAVTLVGSRANTAYGARVATDLAYELASHDWTIVSGAAFGIDTCAHRAALSTGHPQSTVAVLACGIERAYPAANTELLHRISQDGTVLTEYAPGSVPAKHRFLVRNRLIAALGAATVVVEAGRRSGTLSTAAAARAQHRVVMAVPGPITSGLSVGCHLLIADRDAQLVTSAADIEAILRPAGQYTFTAPAAAEADVAQPHLDDDTARIHAALPARRAISVAEIARLARLPTAEVLGGLALLDLAGLATRTSTGWRKTPPPATIRGRAATTEATA